MKLTDINEGEITSDCRDDVGITVGLIDGLIAQVRILRDRDLEDNDVDEVFMDLADDEDFAWLCNRIQEYKDSGQ